MFPILLVTQSKRTVDAFVKKLVKEKKYSLRQVYSFEPDPNLITIDQVREIKSMFVRKSEEIVIVVYKFDTAKVETQNALLKTLEEKNQSAQFILHIQSESSVLPTIISRCKIIKLLSQTVKKNDSLLPHSLSEYSEITKEKAIALCDEWLDALHQKLHNSENVDTASIKEILKIRNLIIKNNLNSQLAIDHLILKLRITN